MDILARRRLSRFLPGSVLGVLCLIILLAPAASAQSLPLYTVSRDDDQLRTVDPLSGVTLTSTPITLAGRTVLFANGLAKNPVNGELFAILVLMGQGPRELVKLNPATSEATDVGNMNDFFAGIAFDANGTLYGVTGDGGTTPETLFTLSTTTGAATLVTALGNGDNGETIAFNPVDGLIYHASGVTTQVFETIDPSNAFAVTDIPQSVDTHDEATSLTHWAGNFFLLAGFSDGLYVISKTGEARFLSAVDHIIKGMVFAGTPPSTCPPTPGTLFGSAFQAQIGVGPSVLYRLDPATGAPTLVGPIGFEAVGAIAFNGAGILYGTGERMDGTDTNVLLTINPCTGAGAEIGPTGIEALTFTRIMDISFRHSDNTLFAFLFGTPGAELATINTSTGQVTLIGLISATAGSGNGIAFAPNDALFQSDTVLPAGTGSLNTIDPATGAPTLVTTLTFSAPANATSRINAMDFQPSTGSLFGSVNKGSGGAAENYLGTINTTTGAVTLINSPNQTQPGLDALAFYPAPDLSITKSGAPNPIIEGDNLTYTVQVTNNGPSAATNVTLSDPLPAGVTFVSATPGQGTCSQAGGTVTCNLGTIAAAAQVGVSIVVRPNGAASLSNTASVAATEGNRILTNDSSTAAGTSLGFTLSNTTGTVTVNAGETGHFTIRVTPGAGGFPNLIAFTSSGVPATVTGSFNPASTTPGNAAVDITFDLATIAPSSAPPYGAPRQVPWPILLLTACALLLLWVLLRRREPRLRRRALLAPLGALLLFAISFLGCSGLPTGGTLAGSYDVTVTATSGTATHSSVVTLVVR